MHWGGQNSCVSPGAFPAGKGLVLTGGSLGLSHRNCRLVSGGHGVLVHRVVRLVSRTGSVRARVSIAFHATCATLRGTGVRVNVTFIRRVTYAIPIRGSVHVGAQDIVNARVPLIRCSGAAGAPACTCCDAGVSLSRTGTTFRGMGRLSVHLSVIRGTTVHLTTGVGGARGHTGTLGGVAVPGCRTLAGSVRGTLRRGRHRRFAHLGIVGQVGRG